MRKFLLLTLVVLTVVNLCACSSLIEILGNSSSSDTQKEIISDDETVSITVPNNWKVPDGKLNELSILEAANMPKEQYVMVISENKIDFVNEFTLEQYFDILKQNYNVENAEWSEPEIRNIGGYKSIYSELSGNVEGVKLFYYLNVVETPTHFYQVIGWTLLSKADKNREPINNVMNTFKVRQTDRSFT